ncbi:hypothetical protein K466DRAFT_603503 [Polyporus arcularius HHB13444]|uniref:Uncharacterized protein n=1 Tax=Polyporus arcularius HHB13444 TaxID=1314778 RepID=A0A5C3P1D3_9APHY|nr:hypothetical protein K466DRAFT_603503 [Polyporus arcularius HHB13444]
MDMSTTFAVVQLDPVRMVGHLDEIALQRARELQPGLYLVFIEGYMYLPIHILDTLNYVRFRLCSNGLTPTRSKRHPHWEVSDCALPIHPNTSDDQKVRPLSVDGAFPYPEGYVWADGVCGRVLLPSESTPAITMPPKETARMIVHFGQNASPPRGASEVTLFRRKKRYASSESFAASVATTSLFV